MDIFELGFDKAFYWRKYYYIALPIYLHEYFFDFQRIRMFFSVFVNFWLFCNDQYEATSQRQQHVVEMAEAGKNLAEERNQNLKETEDLRQKRQTIAIQKDKVSNM